MAKIYTATGRRKSSVAQVKMTAGKGKITVNGQDVREFMPYETYVMDIMQGDTLEEMLIEDGEKKIQVNLIDWFNEINPFVWRDFDGNIITE